MKKIAIVNSSSFGQHFPDQLERLNKIGEVTRFTFPPDAAQSDLIDKLSDFDYIVASVTPFFKEEFFKACPKLKLISRHGIGYNNVDIASAEAHQVMVTIVSGIVEQDAVAENAIALLMAASRRVVSSTQAAKAGLWKNRAEFMGYQISGKVTGVIGLGNIGSKVGYILKNGFDNRVLAYDPNLSDEEIIKRGAEPATLEQIIEEADFISLNAFLSESNYHMIGAKELKKMKKSMILVNTARGALVDDKAVLDAVKNNEITAYASDVVEGEPVGAEYLLFGDDRIIISPHTSAYTWECLHGMGEKVVDDIEKVEAGKIPEVLVTKEAK